MVLFRALLIKLEKPKFLAPKLCEPKTMVLYYVYGECIKIS